jgi:hypothetical protein
VVHEDEDNIVPRNIGIQFHIGATSRPVPEERNSQTKYFEKVKNKKMVGML